MKARIALSLLLTAALALMLDAGCRYDDDAPEEIPLRTSPVLVESSVPPMLTDWRFGDTRRDGVYVRGGAESSSLSVVRASADGATTLFELGPGEVRALVSRSDDDVLVGGRFEEAPGLTTPTVLLRFDGRSLEDLGPRVAEALELSSPLRATVHAADLDPSDVAVALVSVDGAGPYFLCTFGESDSCEDVAETAVSPEWEIGRGARVVAGPSFVALTWGDDRLYTRAVGETAWTERGRLSGDEALVALDDGGVAYLAFLGDMHVLRADGSEARVVSDVRSLHGHRDPGGWVVDHDVGYDPRYTTITHVVWSQLVIRRLDEPETEVGHLTFMFGLPYGEPVVQTLEDGSLRIEADGSAFTVPR